VGERARDGDARRSDTGMQRGGRREKGCEGGKYALWRANRVVYRATRLPAHPMRNPERAALPVLRVRAQCPRRSWCEARGRPPRSARTVHAPDRVKRVDGQTRPDRPRTYVRGAIAGSSRWAHDGGHCVRRVDGMFVVKRDSGAEWAVHARHTMSPAPSRPPQTAPRARRAARPDRGGVGRPSPVSTPARCEARGRETDDRVGRASAWTSGAEDDEGNGAATGGAGAQGGRERGTETGGDTQPGPSLGLIPARARRECAIGAIAAPGKPFSPAG